MLNILTVILGVICNFILYLSFGSLITRKKDHKCPFLLSVVVGFFFYYFVFFFVCVIPMKYYRPLSMLTKMWVPTVAVIVLLSAVLNGSRWVGWLRNAAGYVKKHPAVTLCILLIVLIQAVLVSCTYNFTLDAAYYVANVATSVETDMMNVYDPFTGAWQDHYEMRYFFATYQMQDSVVCQLTGIPALIWTKSVMAVTVMVLTNIVYLLVARELFIYGDLFKGSATAKSADESLSRSNSRAEASVVIMMAVMLVINLTFITIYTSSLFLMTRTYEGKAIVGNLAVITLFYLFMRMNDDRMSIRPWLLNFVVCFGAATISSSANMLLPVELTVLFLPMIVRKKAWRMIPGYFACVIPGVVFSLIFVLYVKGYFVFYTFPK
ncbi:MAG: hypothetical protein K6F34_02445 [Lachnospiraceae bacterium]|nr:hypothetical protein [Lachnospiraceae bacterium]